MVTRRQSRLRVIAVADAEEPAARSRTGLRWALAGLAFVVGWAGIGGVIGVVVGIGAAAGVGVMGRGVASPPRAAPEAVPVVIELLAGCLDAGLTMADALDAASVAGDEVTAAACLATAAALRRGAPAAEAWHGWMSDPWLEPVARSTARTTRSGARVADELRAVAARVRSRRQARLQQRVQQASVWVVVPLGLFFLPAFVLIAVVPVVMGLFGGIR